MKIFSIIIRNKINYITIENIVETYIIVKNKHKTVNINIKIAGFYIKVDDFAIKKMDIISNSLKYIKKKKTYSLADFFYLFLDFVS